MFFVLDAKFAPDGKQDPKCYILIYTINEADGKRYTFRMDVKPHLYADVALPAETFAMINQLRKKPRYEIKPEVKHIFTSFDTSHDENGDFRKFNVFRYDFDSFYDYTTFIKRAKNIKLFNIDVNMNVKICQDLDIPIGGWIDIPAAAKTPLPQGSIITIARQLYKSVNRDAIAKLKIAAFDLEAESQPGIFPSAKKNWSYFIKAIRRYAQNGVDKFTEMMKIAFDPRYNGRIFRSQNDVLCRLIREGNLCAIREQFDKKTYETISMRLFGESTDRDFNIGLMNYPYDVIKIKLKQKGARAGGATLDRKLFELWKYVQLPESDDKKVTDFMLANFGEPEGDRIISASIKVGICGDPQYERGYVISIRPCRDVDQAKFDMDKSKLNIINVADESELLSAFVDIMREEDPDFITGYNIFGFDYPFMKARFEENCNDKWKLLGRPSNDAVKWRTSSSGGSDTGFKQTGFFIEMPGRMTFDMYEIALREKKLKNYRLDTVCEAVLGKNKVEVNHEKISLIFFANEAGAEYICAYNFRDSEIVLALCMKMRSAELIYAMISVTKSSPDIIINSNGKSKMLMAMVSKFCSDLNIIIPKSPGRKYEPYEGAIVLKPEKGVYAGDNEIYVGDFNSLYPNNILFGNLCPSSKICNKKFRLTDAMIRAGFEAKVITVPVFRERKALSAQAEKIDELIAKKRIAIEKMKKKDGPGFTKANELLLKYEAIKAKMVEDEAKLKQEYAKEVATCNSAADAASAAVEYDENGNVIVADDEADEEDEDESDDEDYDEEIGEGDIQYKSKTVCTEVDTRDLIFIKYPAGRRAIIPEIEDKLLATRKKYKDLMKAENKKKSGVDAELAKLVDFVKRPDDPNYTEAVAAAEYLAAKGPNDTISALLVQRAAFEGDYDLYDTWQLAFKVVANSMYGLFGARFCPLYDPDIAGAVTAIGREKIMSAKAFIEGMGYKVIYGDTDSLFVLANRPHTLAEVQDMFKKVTAHIGANYKMEFEKKIKNFVLQGKKMYIGHYYEDLKNETTFANNYQIHYKGICITRRDVPEVVKKIIGDVYETLPTKSADVALAQVRDFISHIRCVPREDFVLSMEYKSDSKNQQKDALISRIQERQANWMPQFKERLEYIYIEPHGLETSKKAAELIENAEFVLANNIPINYRYYINNKLKKRLLDIFALPIHSATGDVAMIAQFHDAAKEILAEFIAAESKRQKAEQTGKTQTVPTSPTDCMSPTTDGRTDTTCFDDMNMEQLKQYCRDHGIKGFSKYKKAELVEFIKGKF